MTNNIWDKRRESIRILLAKHSTNATQISLAAGMSPNTVTKFLNGRTATLSSASLEKLATAFGLPSANAFDAENPLGSTSSDLSSVIPSLTDAERAEVLAFALRTIEARR